MQDALDLLASELFKTFSRFEYALKANEFHNGDGEAKPNWRKYAESIPKLFDSPADPNLKEAVEYILSHPPKKQMVTKGQLEWSDSAPTTDLHSDLVLLYVRRVRNNLFHGGKFNGRWFEPQRSEQLLRHSLTVLKACLEASPDMQTAFGGGS